MHFVHASIQFSPVAVSDTPATSDMHGILHIFADTEEFILLWYLDFGVVNEYFVLCFRTKA